MEPIQVFGGGQEKPVQYFLLSKLQFINSLRSPLLRNSLAVIVLRGSTTIVRLIVLFLVARFVSPTEFGMLVLALAIAEIAKVVADFGVDTLAIRQFALLKTATAQQTFASTVAITKIICGVLVYLLLLTFFLLKPGIVQTEIGAITGLLVLTGLWSNFSINYFQARLKIEQILLPVLLSNFTSVTILGFLFLYHPVMIFASAILPLSEAINAYILLHYFRRTIEPTTDGVQFTAICNLLRHATPLAVSAIIITIYTRLDVVILTNFLDKAAVGYYGIAFRMTEPFQFAAVAFAMSLYSHLSAVLVDSNFQKARRFIVRYCLGVLSYGIVSCLVLALVAPFFIRWLLPNYNPAIPILQILAVALVFRTLNGCLTSVIRAHGRFTWITAVAAWNLIMIGGLLWLCVPMLGVAGAALALLIAEVLNTVLQTIMINQAACSKANTIANQEVSPV